MHVVAFLVTPHDQHVWEESVKFSICILSVGQVCVQIDRLMGCPATRAAELADLHMITWVGGCINSSCPSCFFQISLGKNNVTCARGFDTTITVTSVALAVDLFESTVWVEEA